MMKKLLSTVVMLVIMVVGGYLSVSAMGGNATSIDWALRIAFYTLILTGILVVLLFILRIFAKPGETLKMVGGLLLLVVVGVISYLLSSGDVPSKFSDITPQVSRISETLIIMGYIVLGVSALSIILDGIKRIL